MKRIFFTLGMLLMLNSLYAQQMKQIMLITPDKNRGNSIMKSLDSRRSIREYSTKELSLQDLSDLLWAAWGINGTNGKRTVPTASNHKDIKVYACMAGGTYLYDAVKNILELIAEGDLRPALSAEQEFVKDAPVVLLIVSDFTQFEGVSEEYAKV